MKSVDLEALTKQWIPFSKLLRVPSNEEEYDEISIFLDRLIDTVGNNEDHPLSSLVFLVGNIIGEYEDKDDVLRTIGEKSDAVDVLKFFMEQHHLKQADLKDIFGTQSNVSEVLNKKRVMNLRHIKELSKRFGVDTSVFID